jgi:hypothetical protein
LRGHALSLYARNRFGNVWLYRFCRYNVSIAGSDITFLQESFASSEEHERVPRINLEHYVEITYSPLIFFLLIEEETAIVEGGVRLLPHIRPATRAMRRRAAKEAIRRSWR